MAGKGVETAALSAMARFFIEARSWDCADPAEVLAQANTHAHEPAAERHLRDRLPGLLSQPGLRYANAGHLPPLLLPAGGGEPGEPPGRGLPLGVERGHAYKERVALGPGDLCCLHRRPAEARRDGELFGAQRLREAAAGAAGGELEELVQAVHQAAWRFSGGLQRRRRPARAPAPLI